MDSESMKQVIEVFKDKDNFLITAHVNPEGDSVGSQIAVYHILKNLKKKAVILNHDKVPDNLRFLSGTELIAREMPEDFQPEVVIILDCPVKERIGTVCECLNGKEMVVNIDHHVSNEFFGDINWVEPRFSSVGEMVFYLFKEMGIKLKKEIMEVIYAAIVTDTGMFNYENTSNETHKIAGELIAGGVDPKIMHSEIFENKSVSGVRLLGKALATLTLEAEGRIAYMSLTHKMYIEEGAGNVSTDEFINFPRSIKGVEIAIFFKEKSEPEKINVSFRSKGRVDVNVLASHFGGGGHARAAGCILNCSLQDAQEKVLNEAKRALGI